MEEHKKIQRLLEILKLLSSNIGYNYSQLQDKLNLTERTIRRYLKSLELAGLFVENNNGYFRLEKNSPYRKDINALLHFSDEEAVLLNEAINTVEKDTQIKINLTNKLFALYNSDRINYPIVKKEDSGKAKLIIEAIRQKKKIKLINYKSSNYGKIADIKVEPYDFTTNYIHLWAFDLFNNDNRMFRISRIQNIEIIDENWEFEKSHKKGKIDVFRMTGTKETPVELNLTIKGCNYLIEQYPLAIEYVKQINETQYVFNAWYTNIEGISRFILSAFDEIEIITPIELKDYLNNKIKNKIF